MKTVFIALSLLAVVSHGHAAEIRFLDVAEEDGRYLFESETHIMASHTALFDVLLDYDNFDRVSSVFKENHYLEPDEDGTPRVYTKARGCITFFCKTIVRVERLEATPYSEITAIIEPEHSDLK